MLVLRRRGDGGAADKVSYALGDDDWLTVERAIGWLRKHAGDVWGTGVPSMEVRLPSGPSVLPVGEVDDVADVLGVVATAARYDSGEGVYGEDCADLACAGIARS